MDKIVRFSLKNMESSLPAQFVQLFKPVQNSPIHRCRVTQTDLLICHLYEACPAAESIFKRLLKPKWEIVPACFGNFGGDHFTKIRINPFPHLCCRIAMQNNTDRSLASDQALYRDALERRKQHDMPPPPFFFFVTKVLFCCFPRQKAYEKGSKVSHTLV